MEEFLQIELNRAERKKLVVGMIMFDIDHFKRFNDTFGHKAGDAVLIEISNQMLRHIRKSDIACRFGGEEFIIILPEANTDITLHRAEQLREVVNHLVLSHDQQPLGSISISCGVAVYPGHGATAEAVIKSADAALYTAKHTGRNKVCMAGAQPKHTPNAYSGQHDENMVRM